MDRLLALVLAAGVVLPGVADFFLARAGYPTLGAFVWAAGYGLMVVFVWYGWLRHLDFGPEPGPE
jgi:hypothetical protein